MVESEWWKPCLAEAFGVLALVFVGAGSIIAISHMGTTQTQSPGALIVGVALAHGLAIAVMVTAFGHISGGHFNPAVTLAVLFTRRIKVELGLLYIVFQLLGGIAGAFLLLSAFPADWWEPVGLGTPGLLVENGILAIDPAKGVLIEAVLTFFLVLVIFGVAIDQRNQMKPAAGLAIGLTITMDILMGGFLTGAAMNPARAFGPALLAKQWADHYVYWAGPILGGIIGGMVYDLAYLEKKRPVAAAGVTVDEGSAPVAPSAPPPGAAPPPPTG